MTPHHNHNNPTRLNPTRLNPPPFHYHPAYGLPDDYRMRILADAEALGVTRAARLHKVSTTVIYQWRRALRESEDDK